jgi:hypothetical protein
MSAGATGVVGGILGGMGFAKDKEGEADKYGCDCEYEAEGESGTAEYGRVGRSGTRWCWWDGGEGKESGERERG